MADLNGDRGQILLVAALALAAVFVLLTVVVNSAIFTENLASRGETVGSDEALALRAATVDGVGETITYANRHNNSDYDALARSVTAETANVSAALRRHYVADGVVVDVTGPHEFANGTRIVDENGTGTTFEGADGDENWTVAEDVDDVRAYRLNVSNGSVAEDSFGSDDAFSLTVENDTAEWRANLTRKSGTFTVGVSGPSTEGTCQVDGSHEYVRVDLTDGTVAGEPCAPLQFARGVSSPYDVSYRNGDAVSGNYSLVVNESGYNNTQLTTPGTDEPYPHDAVYSVVVRYRYDGPQLHYETNVTVAPGEPR